MSSAADPPERGRRHARHAEQHVVRRLCTSDRRARDATTAANVTTVPQAISRPDPAYSERARALGIEGTVKIQFDVNNDGGLENVQVISATPRNVFERDVRQVTRRWRYESGKPGKNIVVTIQFKLSGVTSTAQ